MTRRLTISLLTALVALTFAVSARANYCPTPGAISFVGDVKPLPDRFLIQPLENPVAGKPAPA